MCHFLPITLGETPAPAVPAKAARAAHRYPGALKTVHLASLFCVTLTVI